MGENNKAIKSIIHNYIQNEKALVKQLYFISDQHGPTIGGYREDIWKELFEQIIPKKYVIEQSVFIIDSNGNQSKEVDLAIFDETYTPYIFRYGRLKFIPIEAVMAVVECKSKSLDKDILKNWVKSIVTLKTSPVSVARIATRMLAGGNPNLKEVSTQTATRPLRILCKLIESFDNEKMENDNTLFDFVITAKNKKSNEEEKLEIEVDKNRSLQQWYFSLNHENEIEPEEKSNIYKADNIKELTLSDFVVEDENNKNVSLLTFNLQLNQLLMLINNPILFPHQAYANMFNKVSKGGSHSNEPTEK